MLSTCKKATPSILSPYISGTYRLSSFKANPLYARKIHFLENQKTPKSRKNAAISRFLPVVFPDIFLIYSQPRKYPPITQSFRCDNSVSDIYIFFSIFSHFRCVQFHPIPYKPLLSVSPCKARCTHQKSDFFSRIGSFNIQNALNRAEYMTIRLIFSRKRKYQTYQKLS